MPNVATVGTPVQKMTDPEVVSLKMAVQDVRTLISETPKDSECNRAVPAVLTLALRLPDHPFQSISKEIFKDPRDVYKVPTQLVRAEVEVLKTPEVASQIHTPLYLEGVDIIRERAKVALAWRPVGRTVIRVLNTSPDMVAMRDLMRQVSAGYNQERPPNL